MKFATANGKNRVCVVGILGYCMFCNGGCFIFGSHSCIIDNHACSRVKVRGGCEK